MRNVTRPAQPPSLRNNASPWRRELLQQIRTCARRRIPVPTKYYDRYKREDVRATLEEMYKKRCSYCEATLGIVDFPHIEHRKPKKRYPELTFVWSNLHLACTKCNIAKRDRYHTRYPILDAVRDVPISEHLTYVFGEESVYRNPLSRRGTTTVDHADLNREDLRIARRKVLIDALDLISKIIHNRNHLAAIVARQRLEALTEQDYGSLISFAIQTFLRA